MSVIVSYLNIYMLWTREANYKLFLRKKKTFLIYFLLSICSVCLSKFMCAMYMQMPMDAREGWIPQELESYVLVSCPMCVL